MEQLNEVNVVRSPLEVVFQEDVDGGFKDERIINSNAPNPRLRFRIKLESRPSGL